MITVLPVWWRHFPDLRSPHAFIITQPYISAVSWWCSGTVEAIWGGTLTYTTVSFVASYQHQPHLFNSDLEGDGLEVLMMRSPLHRACWTKEPMETNSPPRDTWITADMAPPPVVLPPWIIYSCKGLDQFVNLSTAAPINTVIPNATGSQHVVHYLTLPIKGALRHSFQTEFR